MGSFTDSLQKNINRVEKEIGVKVYTIAKDLFLTTISLTPNGTKWSRGNLINDWHVAANSYSQEKFSPLGADNNSTVNMNSDPTGSGSIRRVMDFEGAKVFTGHDGFVSLSNSQHYALNAEYTGWPAGKNNTGGWDWTGNVKPYAMVQNALTIVSAKYR